ncbi:MAG: TetR/AcrR family transcriptional regulator [Novosphingobium sp.]|nr:TetR/AcrR family transcriptional regulator [Novosphingobium sp.]
MATAPILEYECDTDVPTDTIFDPFRPVLPVLPNASGGTSLSRQSQRQRRSAILATIRQLLTEDGYEGITVRRIAEMSGRAVQTIYNLVGPRDLAIVEAISDYTISLSRLAPANLDDPDAVLKTIAWQDKSVMAAPEFCRQVCRIYFTPDRHIFYDFRDRQVRNVHALLVKQQRNGILRSDVVCRDLAEQLTLFASALYVDWADRPFELERLSQRLASGYAYMLGGALNPRFTRTAAGFAPV